jgi:uncharacterized repeat protein (TIGR01451 family)
VTKESSTVLLTKTAKPIVAGPGTNITYTLLVTNEGPSIVSSTVVTDTMPAGSLLFPPPPAREVGSTPMARFTWNIGILTNNTSASLQIVGTSPFATALTNSAVLAFAEGNLAPYDDLRLDRKFFVYDFQRTLSITPRANPPGVLITWPFSSANFLVQINTNLNAGWTFSTNAVFTSNGLNAFTNSLKAPQTFFRLAPP